MTHTNKYKFYSRYQHTEYPTTSNGYICLNIFEHVLYFKRTEVRSKQVFYIRIRNLYIHTVPIFITFTRHDTRYVVSIGIT